MNVVDGHEQQYTGPTHTQTFHIHLSPELCVSISLNLSSLSSAKQFDEATVTLTLSYSNELNGGIENSGRFSIGPFNRIVCYHLFVCMK